MWNCQMGKLIGHVIASHHWDYDSALLNSFFSKTITRDTHSLHPRVSYGMFFISCISDISCTFVADTFVSILSWITNNMLYKVQDEITYPFPNFNSTTDEVREWLSNLIPHFITGVITYAWD